MKTPDGATTSSWYEGVKVPTYSAPSGTLQTGVCVVGAGIAGLTSAYLLARDGREVIVVDEGPIGSGQTGRTSAHLASAIDDRFVEIERLLGADASKMAYESHAAGIDMIERIALEGKIECEFKRLNAYLFSVPGDAPDLLEKELAAAQRAGFKDCEKAAMVTLCGREMGPCIRFGAQARFHPLKYIVGLAAALERMGVKIYTGRRIKDVQGADSKKNQPPTAMIEDGPDKITAQAIVVATNTPSPINDWMGIYTKQVSYRSYVIAVEAPRGAVSDALYWDTLDPYHYVRIEPGADGAAGDLVLIGGEDHRTGEPPDGDPFGRLEAWGRLNFPMIGKVRSRWSGQVQEPSDGIAFIGKAPTAGDNVYVITGDSGMGLTHATLGAMLVSDLIAGRNNPWSTLYDPTRKQVNLEFFKEGVGSVAPYVNFLTPGEIDSEDKLRPGEGAVVRHGLKKVAAFRDEQGKMHLHSAACTHLACPVMWNAIEKTFDCPCHGSRFGPEGQVLMGPAIDDLKDVES